MRLSILTLADGEHAFQFSIDSEKTLLPLKQEIEDESGLKIEKADTNLLLTKLDPDYYLRGKISLSVEQNCSRCMESFKGEITHPIEVGLLRVAHTKKKGEKNSDESEELDLVFFEGPLLDLKPILKEQILLGLPYQPLCKTDCLGICQSCGYNLNLGSCNCNTQILFKPFANLKKAQN
jgi:uncharacterized protein